MKPFIFFQSKSDEYYWYIVTQARFVTEDFTIIEALVLDQADAVLPNWRSDTTYFNLEHMTFKEYETQEELIAKHMEDIL